MSCFSVFLSGSKPTRGCRPRVACFFPETGENSEKIKNLGRVKNKTIQNRSKPFKTRRKAMQSHSKPFKQRRQPKTKTETAHGGEQKPNTKRTHRRKHKQQQKTTHNRRKQKQKQKTTHRRKQKTKDKKTKNRRKQKTKNNSQETHRRQKRSSLCQVCCALISRRRCEAPGARLNLLRGMTAGPDATGAVARRPSPWASRRGTPPRAAAAQAAGQAQHKHSTA